MKINEIDANPMTSKMLLAINLAPLLALILVVLVLSELVPEEEEGDVVESEGDFVVEPVLESALATLKIFASGESAGRFSNAEKPKKKKGT